MKKSNKKRQLLAASLIIALAAAVTVNWYYSRSVPETQPSSGEAGEMLGDTVLVAATAVDETAQADDAADAAAFSELQLKQTQSFERMEETIEAVLSNEQLDAQAQAEVAQLLETLKTARQSQSDCETLIRAKVGGQAIVLLDDNTAQVVVERGRLNEQTTLQITEIMQTKAQISPENLTILEVNS